MPTFTFGPILEGHYDKLAMLQQQAYPHAYSGSEEERRHFEEQFRVLDLSEDLTYYGAYENGELIGAMMTLKFDINFHGHMTRAFGIASVAVDLIHKKRGVAKELILFSLELAKAENCPIFTLYPFNPKFYINFGFGLGSPIYRYKLPPHCFKSTSTALTLTHSALKEPKAILALYDAVLQCTHGMMNKSTLDKRRLSLLKNAHLLTVTKEKQIVGYMIYEQKSLLPEVYPLKQKLIVHEMLYSIPQALESFCHFFSTQHDQVDFIELSTFNPDFHHILEDIHFVPQPELLPLIGHKASDRGHGLMYRTLDPDYLLSQLPNKSHRHLVFYIQYPREAEPQAYAINPSQDAPIELHLSLSHFSSWIMGCVSLWSLYQLGQLHTDTPETLKSLDHAFNLDSPMCLTRF